MNLYAIPNFLTALLAIGIGIFVISKSKKTQTGFSFFLLALSTFIWQLGMTIALLVNKENLALLGTKVSFFGIALIPITSYHVTSNLLRLKRIKTIIFGYILSLLVFVPLSWTDLILNGVYKYQWGYFFKAGYLHPIFMIFFISYMLLVFAHLFTSYKKETNPLEKNRKKYFFTALSIAYIGSVDYLPTYGISFYPFGYLPVICCVLTLAYAIQRYNLMDVRIAVTRAGIFLIVYAAVLGIPFYIGFQTKSWFLATVSMLILATLGPSIYNSLRRRAEDILLCDEKTYQRSLETSADKIAFMRNIDEIASLIVNDCLNNIKLKYASLYVYDEINHEYKIVKNHGSLVNSINGIISADDALITALENKREILIADELHHNPSLNNNVSNSSRILKTMQEINASLIAPCFIKKGLIGFLVFGEKESKRHFTEDDLTTFSILANKTAIGIENDLHDKKMYDQTQKEAVTDLAFNAAHQFQNNLTKTDSTAGAMSYMLKQLNLDAISLDDAKSKIKACIAKFDQITEITQDGAKIISSILDKQKAKEEFKSVNLHNIVQTAVKNSSTEKQKSILEQEGMITPVMLNQIPKDVKEIPANESLLQNAFLNLINNACDACIEKHRRIKGGSLPEYKGELPYKAKITISIKELKDTILIKVEDNGLGMKEDAKRRLFVPFATTKGPSKGHGIGLNVVREIVEKDHNGKVSAQTQYGEGTTFTIELPKKMKGL